MYTLISFTWNISLTITATVLCVVYLSKIYNESKTTINNIKKLLITKESKKEINDRDNKSKVNIFVATANIVINFIAQVPFFSFSFTLLAIPYINHHRITFIATNLIIIPIFVWVLKYVLSTEKSKYDFGKLKIEFAAQVSPILGAVFSFSVSPDIENIVTVYLLIISSTFLVVDGVNDIKDSFEKIGYKMRDEFNYQRRIIIKWIVRYLLTSAIIGIFPMVLIIIIGSKLLSINILNIILLLSGYMVLIVRSWEGSLKNLNYAYKNKGILLESEQRIEYWLRRTMEPNKLGHRIIAYVVRIPLNLTIIILIYFSIIEIIQEINFNLPMLSRAKISMISKINIFNYNYYSILKYNIYPLILVIVGMLILDKIYVFAVRKQIL